MVTMKPAPLDSSPLSARPRPRFPGAARAGVAAAVVAIVWAALPSSFSSRPGQPAAAGAELTDLSMAVRAFERDVGQWPSEPEGLAALTARPADASLFSWRGPYVEPALVDLRDPWGRPWIYHTGAAANGRRAFLVLSVGPDGVEGTADDVSFGY
jgi:general secretion pathway protein G